MPFLSQEITGESRRGGIVALVAVLFCSLSFNGCSSAENKAPSAPAKPAVVEKLPQELELATVTLSPEAVSRLGIATNLVERRSVSPRRTLGGEAIVPNGNTLVVTAPLSGIVSVPAGSAIPLPGTTVAKGEVVLSLIPLLSPEHDVLTPAERVQLVGARAESCRGTHDGEGDVQRSQAEVAAIKITLERSEQLFQDRAGPRRAAEDASASFHVAESILEAAKQRELQLSQMLELLQTDPTDGRAFPLPMTAPLGGIVNRVSVSQGQTVSANAALFEIINLDTIWIRVPVFVDQLSTIQQESTARLVSLGGEKLKHTTSRDAPPGASSPDARPILAPPSADSQTSSADLYYEIDNRALGLRPGQRVGVDLPLRGATDALVVPASSLIYDIYGGTWVYVASGENQFARQRVSLRWIEDGDAMLELGPPSGSTVVVTGAASFSAPNLAPESESRVDMNWLIRTSLAISVAGFRAGDRADHRRHSDFGFGSAGCFSRVCAAAGRDSNRSTRHRDRRRREPDHRSDRERGQRHPVRANGTVEIGLGLSSVRLIFEPGTDLLIARQLVQERLGTRCAALPMVARPPVILPPLSSLSRCLKIGLWSDTQSQMDMTVLTKWTIRPRLMSIPGVANVAVWGEKEPQLQVVVDPDRLRANNLDARCDSANRSRRHGGRCRRVRRYCQSTAGAAACAGGLHARTARRNRGLGLSLRRSNPRGTLQFRPISRSQSPNSTSRIGHSAADQGRGRSHLRLRSADRRRDHQQSTGSAADRRKATLGQYAGRDSRTSKSDGRNCKPRWATVAIRHDGVSPGDVYRTGLTNLSHSMLLGCVCGDRVLLLFLFDWRCAVISATAIPLSLLAAVMVLY